ncbi:MAG: hypothetical protein PVH89_02765 [Gammaproteobacteria bacterium]|jgi:hypothetical protein
MLFRLVVVSTFLWAGLAPAQEDWARIGRYADANAAPATNAMIQGNLASMAEIAAENDIRVVLSSILPTDGCARTTSSRRNRSCD